MITEVDLSGTPCFAPDAKLTGLKNINFIFGPNGSGKTTLSNKIQAIDLNDEETEIEEIAVFNRDYIKDAFRTCQAPGHITLGKQSSTLQDEINALNLKLEEEEKKLEIIDDKIKQAKSEREKILTVTLGSMGDQRKKLATTLKEYDSLYPKSNPLIPGTNPALFSKLQEFDKASTSRSGAEHESLEGIIEMLRLIPEAGAREIGDISIPVPKFSLTEIENLLNGTVSLNTESALSTFIDQHKLHNWIRQGLSTVEQNNLSSCPFCQQNLAEQIVIELKGLFDKEHESHINAIKQAFEEIKDYAAACNTLTQTLTTSLDHQVIDYTSSVQTINNSLKDVQHIQDSLKHKLIEPNSSLTSELTEDPFQTISEHISLISSQIRAYNASIRAGKSKRKQDLQAARDALYQFLTTIEFRETLDTYNQTSEAIDTNSPSKSELNTIKQNIKDIRATIAEKQAATTQVGEKMAFINLILSYIGFKSFSLTLPDLSTESLTSQPSSGQYILIRHNSDGSTIPIDTSTLSEGERTLLTFLYFIAKYYDDDKSTTSTPLPSTLLVIDDPIASTDAETFFLITNIIRRLLDQVSSSNNNNSVKQVIITSHNTRFLKEVAFSFLNEKKSDSKACYYSIQKGQTGSSIFGPKASSFITNEYNELWAEVRRCNKIVVQAHKNHKTPQAFPLLGNTMRRIIESYFLDIGGLGTITSLSKSTDRRTATLLAFCNSSSHSSIGSDIYDILHMDSFKLLTAFRRVFETLDGGQHIGHYRMMMRDRPGDTSQQNS
jgi:hypothetical protein